MTGRGLNETLYHNARQVHQLCGLLRATPQQLSERVESLINDNKKLKKQLKKGAVQDVKSAAQQLLDDAVNIGGAMVIIGEIPSASVDAIRGQIDWLRKKAASCVIVLGSPTEDSKVLLFAAVTDDLIKKGLKAGDIVKQIAPMVGGGGGGRPQMAQAGGKKPEQLPAALEAARNLVEQGLQQG